MTLRPPPALLVDLYELTMAQAYVDAGLQDRPATFSLFTRRLPPGWGYLVVAGLDTVLSYLEELRFDDSDLAYLEETGLFRPNLLDTLAGLRFTGDVRAMPEGTAFFANEPVLEVDGPLLEAQLVETVVINEIHFQSLVAGKAARCVDVAGGRTLVDFALRRTHGPDAGMRVARSSYLAGFDATSNVLAGRSLGIPVAGTMAHSFVQAFEGELDAFRAYAHSYPGHAILLVDTYDTPAGLHRAAVVARELAAAGHRLVGVRLDSGNMAGFAREARSILDAAGARDAIVFASGGLDERDIAAFAADEAPIDGYGVGSRLGTVADSPYLDCAYKLVGVDGRPTLKLSAGKATLPGPKQVWRIEESGRASHDVVGLATEAGPEGGRPLLVPVMRAGRRLTDETLADARERCVQERLSLPPELRAVDADAYDVRTSDAALALRDRAAALYAGA